MPLAPLPLSRRPWKVYQNFRHCIFDTSNITLRAFQKPKLSLIWYLCAQPEVSRRNTSARGCRMMIIRTVLRAQAPRIASRRVFRIASRPIKTARRYSTSNASMSPSTPQSQASMLATITTDLDKIAPRFEVEADQITIIQTPKEFYETLKVGPHLP